MRLDAQFALGTPPDSVLTENQRFSWHAYVPLDFVLDSTTLNKVFGIRQEEPPYSTEHVPPPLLDSLFNPVGGPNEGQNLVMQRKHFMDSLNTFTPERQPVDPQAVLALRDEGLGNFKSLLIEDPYRIMFDITTSHAIARSGSSTMASAILEETILDISCADCVYQLAHLDALAGQMDRSIEGIESLSEIAWHSTRALYDGPQLQLRIGIETRDQEAIDIACKQLRQVARALRVVAIEASGDLEQARSAANDVHKELTPNLLPAILVEEVLERTSS